jgi:hypothetical protein
VCYFNRVTGHSHNRKLYRPKTVLFIEPTALLMNVTYLPPHPQLSHLGKFHSVSVNIFYVPTSIDQRERFLQSTAPFSGDDFLLSLIRDFSVISWSSR